MVCYMKSTANAITKKISHIEKGKPFSTAIFSSLGTRSSIDKTVSRLAKSGNIERVARGVYIRPLYNRIIGSIKPSADEVVKSKLKAKGEIIQSHGAEALRFFKISTQAPLIKVYYTNSSSREINVEGIKVKLIHTNDKRKLAHADTNIGLALSALWYLGKEQVNNNIIKKIHTILTNDEFTKLLNTPMPIWMSQALATYQKGNNQSA